MANSRPDRNPDPDQFEAELDRAPAQPGMAALALERSPDTWLITDID